MTVSAIKGEEGGRAEIRAQQIEVGDSPGDQHGSCCEARDTRESGTLQGVGGQGDRKSTRLNSSHDQISYAVFCLKKKKPKNTTRGPTSRASRTVGLYTTTS